MTPEEQPSLGEVRARLRERGYLEGRLAGWIATGSGSGATITRRALAAGARVGLVGGPILALPVMAALALSARPHAPDPLQLLGLWLFLSALLGAALGLLEAGADLTLSWLARRGVILLGRAERLAGRVGLLFAGAASLYLLFHVRAGRTAALPTGGADSLPGWLLWGAVMLAALGAGHVVGRIARLGSLGPLLLTAPGAPGAGRRRPGRWTAAAAWAAVLAAAALLVFIPSASRGDSQAAPIAVRPVAVPGRIVFIGVDGLDASLLDTLDEPGEPATLRGLARGAARYRVVTSEPPVPPRRWTTAVTGRPSGEHGVVGYQAERIAGLATPVQTSPGPSLWPPSPRLLLPPRLATTEPVDSRARRSLAVWEILASQGVPSAALNWWATWPAPRRPGAFVVSDRAFARLQAGRAPDRDSFPELLESRLRDAFPADLTAAQERLAAVGLGPGLGAAASGALADAWHARVAARLLRDWDVRFVALYLPGVDIARRSEPGALAGALKALDLAIEDVLRETRPDDLIVVVGDPGREGGLQREAGLALLSGERIASPPRPGASLRMQDLAPTLLALAGFPAALDLPGRAILDSLAPGDPSRRLPTPIATYGRAPDQETEQSDDPFGREVLDRLRGLGYIQ